MLLIGVSFVHIPLFTYFICATIFSVGLEHSCDSMLLQQPCCCNCLMHFVELSKK